MRRIGRPYFQPTMGNLLAAFGLVMALTAYAADASIININADDDGSGAFVVSQVNWDSGSPFLSITANQYWAPGRVLGSVTTDTELDPTLWVINSVANNTGGSWIAYDLNVSMNKPFSIVGVIAPSDWTWSITPPALNGSDWTGNIGFTSGTPIGVNESGSFGYVVSFVGSVNFAQTAIPMPVPEPVPLATLPLIGVALLARHLHRRA